MLFNSIHFLFFFPIVAGLYFFGVRRIQSHAFSQGLLLLASLYFYMSWNPAYLALILISIVITWTSGLWMEGRSACRKRVVLVVSLASNLAILFIFKYYNFFSDTVDWLCSSLSMTSHLPAIHVLLPVGISFYTFQALGYSIDVYRGQVEVERSLLTYALFVTFFPQLVAGPIERTGNLLPQFKVEHDFDYDRVVEGLILAAWGMFKKVAIADRLAVYVNSVYGDPAEYCGIALALGTFFFAFQILCDFSGYSDIAIGISRILGFNLMANFRSPYFARSIADFWRRWHISLSTWFRDYLYIPLGGNRVSVLRKYLNLFITFLASGVWHGAAWNFIVWGGLHGLFQIAGQATKDQRAGLWRRIEGGEPGWIHRLLQVYFTFCAICFTWIFFRADTLSDATFIADRIMAAPAEAARIVQIFMAGQSPWTGQFHVLTPDVGVGELLLCLLLISVLAVVDYAQENRWSVARIRALPWYARWPLYYALLQGIVLLGMFGTSEFIYFQF